MFGLEQPVFTGARIPYHVTSRHRLPGVTADVLRGAAVNVPPGSLDQSGTWTLRGHLCLTTEARRLLPPIMGGLCAEVGYDASVGSRAALLRAAAMCPSRRELAYSLHMETLGFASADPVGPSPILRVADLGDDGTPSTGDEWPIPG